MKSDIEIAQAAHIQPIIPLVNEIWHIRTSFESFWALQSEAIIGLYSVISIKA